MGLNLRFKVHAERGYSTRLRISRLSKRKRGSKEKTGRRGMFEKMQLSSFFRGVRRQRLYELWAVEEQLQYYLESLLSGKRSQTKTCILTFDIGKSVSNSHPNELLGQTLIFILRASSRG